MGITLFSPSRNLQIAFWLKDGQPFYKASYENAQFISDSILKISTKPEFQSPFTLENHYSSKCDEVWLWPIGEEAHVKNHYNETLFKLTDANGKMNLALADVGGAVLVISQFTLYGDASHGNRPSFIQAARPEQATALYELFCRELSAFNLQVERGIFGAHMDVSLTNDGPVTIIIDSESLKYGRKD